MRQLRLAAGPVYLTACILVLLPFLETLLTLWPFNPGLVQWRYGAVGIGSRALMTPALGLLMILIMAAWTENRSLLRWYSIFSLVGAVVLVLLIPLFALDVVQMRSNARPEALATFDVSAGVAFIRLLAVAGVMTAFFLASRRMARDDGARSRPPRSPVVSEP